MKNQFGLNVMKVLFLILIIILSSTFYNASLELASFIK